MHYLRFHGDIMAKNTGQKITDILKDTLEKIESMTFTLQTPDDIPPEPEEDTPA